MNCRSEVTGKGDSMTKGDIQVCHGLDGAALKAAQTMTACFFSIGCHPFGPKHGQGRV